MAERKRFPLNVDGPFYVLDGCCTACDVPFTEAPELFAMHESDKPDEFRFHCYFKRQPRDDIETEQAIQAMYVQELGCIRFAGKDARVLARLRDLGLSEYCDAASQD